MHLAIRNAAAGDTAIDHLWQQIQRERLVGVTGLARHLAAVGGLRSGVAVDQARDILWTCISVEI
ncbi:hypothetical protein ACTFF1_01570, partial [Campylobacter jejuni]